MIESLCLCIGVPSDPLVAGFDGVDGIAQSDQADELPVRVVKNQKPQPTTVAFGNRDAPMQACILEKPRLNGLRLDLVKTRTDIDRVDFVTGGYEVRSSVSNFSNAGCAICIRLTTACSCRFRMLRLSRRWRKLTALSLTWNPCAFKDCRIARRSLVHVFFAAATPAGSIS